MLRQSPLTLVGETSKNGSLEIGVFPEVVELQNALVYCYFADYFNGAFYSSGATAQPPPPDDSPARRQPPPIPQPNAAAPPSPQPTAADKFFLRSGFLLASSLLHNLLYEVKGQYDSNYGGHKEDNLPSTSWVSIVSKFWHLLAWGTKGSSNGPNFINGFNKLIESF
nr:hypothetical protein Iba_chr15dCG5480 [Ipomoea batatas]